ncbi:MAG: hypothetical protein QXR87_00780 [Candidatus Hadarchaeales archaeon]
MGATRALGALLTLVCAVVFVLYVLFAVGRALDLKNSLPSWLLFTQTAEVVPVMIWLPVTIGIWVVCGLGAWLGWIMATTKEVAPVPVEKEEKTKEKEEKAGKAEKKE